MHFEYPIFFREINHIKVIFGVGALRKLHIYSQVTSEEKKKTLRNRTLVPSISRLVVYFHVPFGHY